MFLVMDVTLPLRSSFKCVAASKNPYNYEGFNW